MVVGGEATKQPSDATGRWAMHCWCCQGRAGPGHGRDAASGFGCRRIGPAEASPTAAVPNC
jgi:hypothetical protein